jgi:hypothetical protein
MQNKPNLLNAQINVTSVTIKNYEEKRPCSPRKNKPNSNPIQTQTNPITKRPKMNVNKVLTRGYENKRLRRCAENKPNSNPNKPSFILPVGSSALYVNSFCFSLFFTQAIIWIRKMKGNRKNKVLS